MTEHNHAFDLAQPGYVTYPNQRYERYERRIGYIRAILSFLKKYRVLLISTASVLTFAVLAFLFCIGLFVGDISCKDHVYGEKLTYSAKAFLADVEYEFAPSADPLTWSSTPPTLPGEYLVRGVTSNPFGMKRYSEAASFTLSPRAMEITVAGETCVYGDFNEKYLQEITRIEGLVLGDTVEDIVYDCSGEVWNLVDVNIPSFRIVNQRGDDVTALYLPTVTGAAITITPRDVSISVATLQKVYNGKPLTELAPAIVKGSFAEGDRPDVGFSEYPSEIGSYTIQAESYLILNSDGEDITYKYNIQWVDGIVTVLPRPITVVAGSAEKVYDDTPLTSPGWKLTEGTVAEGQQLQVIESGSQTMAGWDYNTPTVTVIDGAGNDVSANYEIKAQVGILKVTHRQLKITTDSAEKMYDGTPLTAKAYNLVEGTVLPHHTLVCEVTGSRKNAGQSDNAVDVKILDANGNNVIAKGYVIIIETGTLTVTKRPITVTSQSDEKVYDGVELICDEAKLTAGTLAKNEFIVSTFSGSQLHAGESENRFTIRVTNEQDEVLTANYSITYEYGKLKVTPRPITITSGSEEKLYDGKPLICEESEITKGSLVDGETLNVNYTGSQTEVGESDNTFRVSSIIDENGMKTTDDYDITYVYGTLTVLPSDIEPPESGEGEGEGEGGGSGEGEGEGGEGGGSGGSGEGEGEGEGEGDGGVGDFSGSTNIGFPGVVDPTLVATIRFDGANVPPHSAYLRAGSYGNYNGKGFDAAVEYIHSKLSPLDYVAHSIFSNGSMYGMQITREEGCPVLIPYFSYSTADLFGNGDIGFNSDRMSYYYPMAWVENITDIPQTFAPDEEAAYRAFVYQQYLQIPESTRQELLKIAKANGIQEDADLYELIRQIQTYIQSAATYNLFGQPYPADVDDVVLYFLTEAKEGICQHFASAGTMMYRAFGIPARYTVGFVGNAIPFKTTEVTADKAHAWVEIYLDGIGWIPVEVTGGGSTGGGGIGGGAGDGGGFVPPQGPVEITIASYGTSKIYDGKPFGEWTGEKVNIISGSLRPGHTMIVTVNESGMTAVNVGTYYNRIVKVVIRDENGTDVTDYYSVKYYEGAMVIKPRPITIQMGSAQKYYDGTPLICETWSIVSGNLLEGDRLTLNGCTSVEDVGTYPNTVKAVAVQHIDSAGKRSYVTKNYQITVLPGTLTILPAP